MVWTVRRLKCAAVPHSSLYLREQIRDEWDSTNSNYPSSETPFLPHRLVRCHSAVRSLPLRGTISTRLAYNPTMQCVGTMSWGIMGITVPAAPGRRTMGALEKSARRTRSSDAQNDSSGYPGDRPSTPAASPKNPAGNDQSVGATAISQTTGRQRTEVRQLEVDWSQVVRRCMDGDSGAWAEMVRAHHKRVYGLCYRFTGNVADAEDLTQDVFLKIYSNLSSFDLTRGSLQVWITTMTRNLLVDNFRRTKNQRATNSLDEGWDATEELKPIDRLTSPGASQHELAAQKELAAMVQEALAQVSVELREAVILRDLQDLDYKEIAQVLGIPEGTVKSRISRGRAELARLLERNKREVM
jgi:RNA polymerase sigma-70 factor, ECF subfamily